MNKLLPALAAALLVAAAATADIPPPKGFKRVPVDHKITTDKEFAGYTFFTVIGMNKVAAVKLGPKAPLEILAKDRGGRLFGCTLVAVPADAAKKYATEKELHEAIAAGKVEGAVKAANGFSAQMQVKDTETRNPIVQEYKLERIDAKEGIVLVPKKGDGKDSPEDEEPDAPVASAPRGGAWAAGLAAAAAVTLGGFWIAARGRRAR